MGRAQRRTGLRAQLLGQPAPDGGVALQRLGAPAGRVQRPHQHLRERLRQRMFVQQRGQRADRHGGFVQDLQPRPRDGRLHALPPPHLARLRHPRTVQPAQRLTPPQPERLAQQLGAYPVRQAGIPRLAHQPTEPVDVDPVLVGLQDVPPGPARHPDPAGRPLAQLAEPGDVRVHRTPGPLGEVGAPHPPDHHVGRHRTAGVHRQHREHGTPLRRSDLVRPVLRGQFNRPEQT